MTILFRDRLGGRVIDFLVQQEHRLTLVWVSNSRYCSVNCRQSELPVGKWCTLREY